MTRVRLHRDPSGRLWWRIPPTTTEAEVAHAVTHATGDAADILARICSDVPALTDHGPLWVVLVRRPESDALVLGAHHAALDGASLALLLSHLVRHYTESEESEEPARQCGGIRPAAGDGASRPQRRQYVPGAGPVGSGGSTGLPDLGDHAVRPFVTGLSRPARIAPGTGAGWGANSRQRNSFPGSRDFPGSHHIPGSHYGVYTAIVPIPVSRSRPDGTRMTVNDMLVIATHAAVELWNHRHGRGTGVIRTRIGVNLRAEDENTYLGNRSGEIMVSTHPVDRVEPARLVQAVSRQTRRAQLPDQSDQPADTLFWLPAVPPALRPRVLGFLLAGTRWLLMPTASVSNLGRLDDLVPRQLGSARITSVHFAAFAGPPQALFVCAAGYSGRLHLTFSVHTSLFDQADIRRFAAVFIDALHDVSTPAHPEPGSILTGPGRAGVG